MTDPASLALAILPLVVGALKAYQAVHQHFRVFRRYSREVKRLYCRFKVQKCLLMSEIEVILHKAAGPWTTSSKLVVDLDNTRWATTVLDRAVSRLLGKYTDVYSGLLSNIAEQLQEIQKDLQCFDALQSSGSRQLTTRVKSAVSITFNKTQFEKQLDALRQDNEALRAIGSYLVPSTGASSSQGLKSSSKIPDHILRTRAACLALHDSVKGYWTCGRPDHATHAAKLCLNPRFNATLDTVALDLAVSCAELGSTTPHDNTLWLRVQTTSSWPKQTQDKEEPPPPKRARCMLPPEQTDFGQHSNICETISQCGCWQTSSKCLGYLEHGSMQLRQTFYHECDPKQRKFQRGSKTTDLAETIAHVRDAFGVEEQLHIASRLASSTLELYSTPWISNEWRLHDISTLDCAKQDSTAFMSLMHVTTQLPKEAIPVANLDAASDTITTVNTSSAQVSVTTPNTSTTAPPVEQAVGTRASFTGLSGDSSPGAEDFELYGVNNTILFSLGVALLEIAHGKTLEQCRVDRDHNLVATARRLAQSSCVLGQKYRRLAQQCLQCDFRCGTVLEERGLQDAVYYDVVHQLDEMMKGLQV